MPKVELTRGRRVALAALPGARKTAAETNLSTGVGVSEARAAKWGQVERLGQIGTAATIHHMEVVEQAQAQTDKLVDLEMDNKIIAWQQSRLWDENNGAMTKRGKNAQGLPEEVGAEYAEFISELGSTLVRPEQMANFQRRAENRRLEMDLTLKRHSGAEYQAFMAGEVKAGVANQLELAKVNAMDPGFVKRALNNGQEIIAMYGPTLGATPEQVTLQQGEFTSAVHGGVIKQLLVKDQTKKAEAYLKEVKGQITNGDVLAEVTAMVDTASVAQDGLTTANQIWDLAQAGKLKTDAIDLAGMETAARAKFGDDAKRLEATIHALRQRKAGVDDARGEERANVAGTISLAISNGATLEQLRRLPAFLGADDATKAAAIDKIEERTNARLARFDASASRLERAEDRAQKQLERKGLGEFWRMSNPEVLRTLSEAQIQAARSVVGDQNTEVLLRMSRAQGASEANLLAATVDQDALDAILVKAKMETRGRLADHDELGAIKAEALRQIEAEQNATHKELTRPQKDAIYQKIADDTVSFKRWGGLADPLHRPTAGIVHPKDRAKAFVPIDQVSATVLERYVNHLRSVSAETRAMTPEQIKKTFSSRLQRAEAIRRLGGTTEETIAILEGKAP